MEKNWSSFFEEMLVRPEETRIAGGKEAKTQWFVHDDVVYCKYYEVVYILFHTECEYRNFVD